LIVLPLELLDPDIEPVIVPIVQLKLLETLAVNDIFGPAPLHTLAVVAFVTVGLGLTVIDFEPVAIAQPPLDVKVKVTGVPELAEAIYWAFSVVAFGVKLPPAPPSVQVAPVALPPIPPPNAPDVPP